MSNNAKYPVIPGDIWEYTDSDREMTKVIWKIASVGELTVNLIKMSGTKTGFKAEDYEIERMCHPKWRWISGNAIPDVTFPCPECEQMKPIHDGDFICTECREKMDQSDQSDLTND